MFPDHLGAGDLELVRWNARFAREMAMAISTSLEGLRRWMPWASSVPAVDQLRTTLELGNLRFEANEDWPYVIRKPDGELVGSTGLHRRAGPDVVEIGYWVRSDRTSRGYATTAARALTDMAFVRGVGIERVEISTHELNAASQAVARKLGYQVVREEPKEAQGTVPEGRFLVWSMSRADWPREGADVATP
jgi:RimJ/RimL family protein N-acetyltransferase